MNINNNTVLITGAGSGIGLEIAKSLLNKKNTILLVGRNEEKLKQASAALDGAAWYVCDIADESAVAALVDEVLHRHPQLNILVNNAGYAGIMPIGSGTALVNNARREINTNYLATLNITEKFLPHLLNQPNAAIINNSSITGLAPSLALPTYSISKAALHAYTCLLRLSLQDKGIKVFELMPPLVDTAFAQAIDMPGKLKPEEVADALITAMEMDIVEVHLGVGKELHQLYQQHPEQAILAMNKHFLSAE